MDWLTSLFVPRFNPRRRLTESLSPPQEADLERLAELRELGSRLDLPHPVRGYLEFESEAAARAVADLLRKESFTCSVRAGQGGAWVTTAVRSLVPTPGAITKLREQLEAVTAIQGGTYQGWDAPAVY